MTIKHGIHFLTEKNLIITENQLLQVLSIRSKNIIKNDDKLIVDEIIHMLENNKLAFSSQEIQFLNSNPQNIWVDYLIFRYKFNNYPKQRIVSDFPNYVLIEPISACNLRCTMCFQIDETFSGDKNFMGKMELDLFKRIIDECFYGGTKAITLASRGEPTLHPNLGEMLEYCSGKFFELKLNTNATKLSDKLIHQILTSGITDMVFSVDSYFKEQYESIRVRGIFEDVLNNIKRFKEIKEEQYPDSKCATRVSGVKVNPKQDPQKFKDFWQEYVDHVVLTEMEYRWDTYHNPTEIAGVNPCSLLWERMYVWYDGICNPCDADYKSELAVGSVMKNSIREIWNGESYTKLRELHLKGKREMCYPCDRCPYGS